MLIACYKKATSDVIQWAFFLRSKVEQLNIFQIKAFIILAEIRRSVERVGGPISGSLRQSNTAPFEEMLLWWRVVGNTLSDLTDTRFEP